MMLPRILFAIWAMSVLAINTPSMAREIQFIEDFVLARDRSKAIQQLIPGTDDHYYYQCLHLQSQQRYDEVDRLLVQWQQRHGKSRALTEIRHRQMLLAYSRTPRRSLDYLIQQLQPNLDHHRDQLDDQPQLPSTLDADSVSYQTLRDRAFRRHKGLERFTDRALRSLPAAELNPLRRRQLLARLRRPDHPDLVEMIIADLSYKGSRGFGSLAIHRNLLIEQLDECVGRKPELLQQSQFVNAYLQKLQPNPDVDWRHDKGEFEAYLVRMWRFVQGLNATHNSLKAHVLYHWLVLDQSQGTYNKQRFLRYLALPRQVTYVAPQLMQDAEARRYPADLGLDTGGITQLPPVANDEPLVRSYLLHFFQDETDYKRYVPFVRDQYLQHLFAEAKITGGLGDPERWYSLLPPEKYQAIKNRVDLDFAPTNPRVFASTDPVQLDVYVKNVQKLIVKVYEINAWNFYRQKQREVDTDVKLDGLVPNQQVTHSYDQPPVRRHRRHFEFPALRKPGVYVIDFIGNGKSSRVVVRKGRLQHMVKTTADGHVFTVFNDQLKKVSNATLWMAGQRYVAGDDGAIVVPFSTKPGRQPVILSQGDLSSLQFFQHHAESYALKAAVHVDRESLLSRQTTTALIRPELRLADTPVSLEVLEDVQLTIQSTDLDGVKSKKVVSDLRLFEDRETPVNFLVPNRLDLLQFTLSAKIKNVSQNKQQTLSDSYQVKVNEIDTSEKIEDVHLSRFGDEYVLDLLGKTGESKPHRVVRVSLQHQDFKDAIQANLATDQAGRILLGALPGITMITATGPHGTSRTWPLRGDRRSATRLVHTLQGEVIEIPYMGDDEELSLLEMRGGTFAHDRSRHLVRDEHTIKVAELPAGDYSLRLHQAGRSVRIRVANGKQQDGFVLGSSRQLELRPLAPLQLASVAVSNETLRIQVKNASELTRVHVFATRFYPAFDPFATLSRVREVEPLSARRSAFRSHYTAGRDLGDEMRYILEREYAKKYPGNMLQRPTLLLNAWPARHTQTATQTAEPGSAFASSAEAAEADAPSRGTSASPADQTQADFANLDFLATSTGLAVNLAPDDQGRLSIPLKEFGPHQHFHVVAIDPLTTVYRSVALRKTKTPFRDLRLKKGLDPRQHYTQQNQTTILAKHATFELADIATGKFDHYDSLSRVYALLSTLSADKHLREFQFILRWPAFSTEEKQQTYSKYVCHELNFFLYHKDPPFFAAVIRPYLESKQHKTFLDLWLLEADLSHFVQPWAYTQLNVVERLLLSERIDGEQERTRRFIEDQFALIPRSAAQRHAWFETTIQGRALENADALGLIAEQRRLSQSEAALDFDFDLASDATPPPVEDRAVRGLTENLSEWSDLSKSRGRVQELRREARLADRGDAGRYRFFARNSNRGQRLYTRVEKTQEWAENNYYHLPLQRQNADLITTNAFWHDYARRAKDQPFLSTNWPEASRNFSEMMFALSLLGLPFEADRHETEFDDGRMTLTTGGPTIIFQQQIRPASATDSESPVLISQHYFLDGDRYHMVQGQRRDKFVTDEFLVHTPYGCQVVVTNPSSSQRRVQLLLQIPHQALPTRGSKTTKTVDLDLPPYHTKTVDYYFYFPAAGVYDHFPVHVAQDEKLLGFAEPATLKVLTQPSNMDRQSWDYVSQLAEDDEVLDFLRKNNVSELNLDRIAFRMGDRQFFEEVITLLAERHLYSHTLWAYGLKHNHRAAVTTYLQHCPQFLAACGAVLQSDLISINPIVRKTYQHLDYRPLVNARAHRLGHRQQILNDRFYQQYHRLLKVLSYRRELRDEDRMAMTYYLLLQDRIEEALEMFAMVQPSRIETSLQYDYFAAYLDCFHDQPTQARAIATKYASYPVSKWRQAFASIASMLDEVEGKEVLVVDPQDRTQTQTAAAAAQANFDLKIAGQEVRIEHQNLDEVQVNYYLIDLELLFSSNPFVQEFRDEFSYVRPNHSHTERLSADRGRHSFELPAALQNRNVVVEVVAAGISRSQVYFSNSLTLQISNNYGQLKVTETTSGKPLPKTYVKVYAEMQDDRTMFYKDGYTDLRGRFDYASLSTNELDFVKRFSLLVLDADRGGLVREVKIPKR